MSLPWTDWQFWVVTASAATGIWMIVRPFLQKRDAGAGCHGCATCPTDDEAPAQKPTLVTLGRRS